MPTSYNIFLHIKAHNVSLILKKLELNFKLTEVLEEEYLLSADWAREYF